MIESNIRTLYAISILADLIALNIDDKQRKYIHTWPSRLDSTVKKQSVL